MKRPFALLLTLLLAIGCLPILALGAPAEEESSLPAGSEVQVAPAVAEVPESADEAASPTPGGEDVRYLTIYLQNDPEHPLPLTINMKEEEPALYVDEAQDVMYFIDEEGHTWLLNMDPSAVDPQSPAADEPQTEEDEGSDIAFLLDMDGQTWLVDLNDENLHISCPVVGTDGELWLTNSDDNDQAELSAQTVSGCDHVLAPYQLYKTFYDQKDATHHYVYKLYNGKCIYCGYVSSGSYTTIESTASHSFGAEKCTASNHTNPNPANHTLTYSKTCTKCGYTATRKVSAGCTSQVCTGQTQSLPPEES